MIQFHINEDDEIDGACSTVNIVELMYNKELEDSSKKPMHMYYDEWNGNWEKIRNDEHKEDVEEDGCEIIKVDGSFKEFIRVIERDLIYNEYYCDYAGVFMSVNDSQSKMRTRFQKLGVKFTPYERNKKNGTVISLGVGNMKDIIEKTKMYSDRYSK
jgi:hypothetical protein